MKDYRGNSALNSGRGVLGGGANPNGLEVALDNTNALGPNTATTGFELRIPFADLGLPPTFVGRVMVAACLERTNGALSNQWMPSLEPGSADLGLAPNLAAVAGVQHASVAVGLTGDVNADGVVNGADLALLLGTWGQNAATAGFLASDLNGDGTVDAADLSVLLSRWGSAI